MKIRRLLAAAAILVSVGGCIDITIGSSPKLLKCSNYVLQTGTALIDPLLGGTLTVGGHSLNVPPGAILEPQLFILTVPVSQYMEIDVTADGLLSFLFQQPSTITIDYSRCPSYLTADKTLKVYHIDPVTKALLENMNGVDDKVARKISFTTDHLSAYGVAY